MKQLKMFFMLISLMLVIGACSNNDNNESEDNIENNDVENNDEQEENSEPEEDVEEVEDVPSADDVDFNALLAEVDEITQGETELIYEQDEAQTHEEDAYEVNLNGYVVANITDFHMNFSIPFDSEDEGAILLTHMSVENKTDGDIAYTPTWSIEYSGADRFANPNRDLIPRDLQLSNVLNSENDYVIPAGESVSGYVAFALRTVDVENIEKVNYASLIVPSGGDV